VERPLCSASGLVGAQWVGRRAVGWSARRELGVARSGLVGAQWVGRRAVSWSSRRELVVARSGFRRPDICAVLLA